MAFWDNWLKKNIQSEISELLKADGVSAPAPETTHENVADKLPETPEVASE